MNASLLRILRGVAGASSAEECRPGFDLGTLWMCIYDRLGSCFVCVRVFDVYDYVDECDYIIK